MENRIQRLEKELSDYYSSENTGTERLLSLIDKSYEEMNRLSPCRRKSALHKLIAENSDIRLFRYFPFWQELPGARDRFDWGCRSYWGGYFFDKDENNWVSGAKNALKHLWDEGRKALVWSPVGRDHHCPGYDTVLNKGLLRIISEAAELLEKTDDEQKKDFYASVIESNRALLFLSARFSRKAYELAQNEDDIYARQNLLRIAEASIRVPAYPAESFYEALACIYFIRESYGNFEGLGMSTYGHLDRMLYKYYKNDVEKGALTREEAKFLIRALLSYTDVRFDKANGEHETSTTIVIGGCDRDGNIVYNEVTKIIIEAVKEGRYYGTKILGRVSSKHPREYIEELNSILLEKIPVFVYINDDVVIGAEVKHGKDIHDARLYVGGGCHEIVLSGTEVDTRADAWLNMPQVFLKTLAKREYSTFDELYGEFLSDARALHDRVAEARNSGEKYWSRYDPAPLYSSSFESCMQNGRDITAGGAKYNSTTLAMVGVATLVDSLYSIKRLVFNDKRLTCGELSEILNDNFKGNELLRREIIYTLPKHFTNNEELNKFSARVLHDISVTVGGQKNARGGKYYPGFYPHNLYLELGKNTGATPDGRLRGTVFSRGYSPSEFVETKSPLDLILSLEHIDFTDYPESSCLELSLPSMDGDTGKNALYSIVDVFIKNGGCTLQINMLGREALIQAKENPEEHKDIIVRVCGYSERFYILSDEFKDEIIARAIR